MQNLLIYTGGAISYYVKNNKIEECIKWREELIEKLWTIDKTIKVYDPTMYFEKRYKYSDETIIDQNTFYLRKSDILIVNTDYILESPGTIAEIDYFYRKRKPRVGFGSDFGYKSNSYTRTPLTEHFDSIDEVIEYVKVCFYV